ncbi:MAG: Gfo/Idh/MocA family protein [Phycisphaeraceae bacterium]
MDKVRLGVIGAGGSMASAHQKNFADIEGLEYVAACDIDADRLSKVSQQYSVEAFERAETMIDSGKIDAVLIACPHYDHPVYAQHAMKQGVHVLVEKPVAVTAKAAEQTNAVYEEARKHKPDLVYAAMFNQRTRADWKMVKRLIDEGRVGELIRVSWTITSWYRSQRYYDSGGWRATWAGEGGGVLINQCPHNLDLFQWFVGMPSRVTANVGLGKHHNIEVEDDVTALLEFDNGATGTFITSTGQSPGINRLEIVGDRGTLISSAGGKVTFRENLTPLSEFTPNSPERFGTPAAHTFEIDCAGGNPEHKGVLINFIQAILHGEPLIAQATEGIHGLELGNAMLMSGLTGEPVDIPTDRDAFDKLLKKLIDESTFEKKTVEAAGPADLSGTY